MEVPPNHTVYTRLGDVYGIIGLTASIGVAKVITVSNNSQGSIQIGLSKTCRISILCLYNEHAVGIGLEYPRGSPGSGSRLQYGTANDAGGGIDA